MYNSREQTRKIIVDLTVENLDYLILQSKRNKGKGAWLRIMGLIETWIVFSDQ